MGPIGSLALRLTFSRQSRCCPFLCGNERCLLGAGRAFLKRNLPFWGGIEEHLRAQKAHRDEHHPECEHLFFWMSEDVRIDGRGARIVPGTAIKDFRESWSNAVKQAHEANKNVMPGLLFHDLRRSGVRVMVQEAGIPESQAMLISGHETRTMLERYNIVSLKNVQVAGAKLDAWSRTRTTAVPPAELTPVPRAR